MLRKVLYYFFIFIVWGLIVTYIVFACIVSSKERHSKRVRSVSYSIENLQKEQSLVSRAKLEELVKNSGIPLLGESVDSVEINTLRKLLVGHGFIDQARIYLNHNGDLYIEATPSDPVVRVLLDGYNSYITSSGVIFEAPKESSAYIPVITGNYNLVTPPKFTGSIFQYKEVKSSQLQRSLDSISLQKGKALHLYNQINRKLIQKKKSRPEKKGRLQSEEIYKIYCLGFEEAKKDSIISIERRLKAVNEKINLINTSIEAQKQKNKNFEERCDDFWNIIKFVKFVNKDPFWKAEIVQIVINNTPDGHPYLELIPRSSDFKIIFGEITDTEEKLAKTLEFYRKILSQTGWNNILSVDVSLTGRVIVKNKKTVE